MLASLQRDRLTPSGDGRESLLGDEGAVPDVEAAMGKRFRVFLKRK